MKSILIFLKTNILRIGIIILLLVNLISIYYLSSKIDNMRTQIDKIESRIRIPEIDTNHYGKGLQKLIDVGKRIDFVDSLQKSKERK